MNVLVDGRCCALNLLTEVVKDQSGKKYSMDDYQIRNPTNVADVARILYDLARECVLFSY